jgi:hypothetical protein
MHGNPRKRDETAGIPEDDAEFDAETLAQVKLWTKTGKARNVQASENRLPVLRPSRCGFRYNQ